MSFGALYVILAACIGYFFASNCYVVKYSLARKAGYYAYLHVTTYGLVLLPIGMLLNAVLEISLDPFGEVVGDAYCGGMVALFVLVAVNLLLDRSTALELAWKDDLDAILYQALSLRWPVQVNLESGEIHVGYVIDTIEPGSSSSYLTIVPLKSGFRDDAGTGEKFVKDYPQVMNGLKRLDADSIKFGLVISTAKILTCRLYDEPVTAGSVAGGPG